MAKRKREQMAEKTSIWLFGFSPRFFNCWFTTNVYIRSSSHTPSNMVGPPLRYVRMNFMPQA